MMTYKTAGAALAALIFLTPATFAASLQNSDAVAYTIYIETEDATTTVTVAPGQVIKDICTNCYIGIEETDDGLSVEGDEKIVIKDGLFTTAE